MGLAQLRPPAQTSPSRAELPPAPARVPGTPPTVPPHNLLSPSPPTTLARPQGRGYRTFEVQSSTWPSPSTSLAPFEAGLRLHVEMWGGVRRWGGQTLQGERSSPLGCRVKEWPAEVSQGRQEVSAGQFPVCGAAGAREGGVNFLLPPPNWERLSACH